MRLVPPEPLEASMTEPTSPAASVVGFPADGVCAAAVAAEEAYMARFV
jgi:hypothetical protein